MIHCGRISYTNDLPVYAAFDAGAVAFPGVLTLGVPTALNQRLLAGELDCSPVSSFFYAQHAAELLLLPGICIGSRREVRSIYCVSAKPIGSLEGVPVTVTRESATGRALFATICATYHDFMPVFVESDDPYAAYATDGSPCLVIGDKAIDAYLAAPRAHTFDLGKQWHDLSGHEMVYAVWAARRDAVEREPETLSPTLEALSLALDWGRRNLDEVIRRAQAAIPRPDGFYAAYYEALNFSFDEAAQSGLSTFFEAAFAAGLLPTVPQLEFFGDVPTHV
ncbi:MAG TPA: menaquinone biosynthesis protein [Candidatus Eremiobacteraceae bacterium]